MSEASIQALLSRLESVASRLERVEKQLGSAPSAGSSSGQASGGGAVEISKSVAEFDNLLKTYIDPYVEASAKIDPLVKQQADLVKQAIQAQRQLLVVASQSKKPATDVFSSLLKPTSDLIGQIIAIRDKNRASKVFNHLSAISEGIPALGWVAVSPTPGPHVDEARASSEFYSNKLLVQYRKETSDEAKNQVNWVTSWNTFLKELRTFVKNYHTTELAWNPQGGDAASAKTAAPAASGGAPPPPPGGAPPPPVVTPVTGGGGDKAAALFAEINAVKERQSGGKTAGLRHVTKDMKTKNQTDKPAPVVQAKQTTGPAPRAGANKITGPPKLSLEGNKWIVENQVNQKEIVISDTEPRHTVYIYRCADSVIQIKGKVNAITVDGCKKTGVVFDNAIAVAEVVNCNSVQLQCTGKVPAVAIDKTSGCQVFLSHEGLGVEIVTSKSDEMNVVLPGVNPGDDITEIAIPEQFKTTIRNRALVTESVAHV